jgi:hypothetical protein
MLVMIYIKFELNVSVVYSNSTVGIGNGRSGLLAFSKHCLNLNSQSDMRQITYLVIVLGTADYWLLNLGVDAKKSYAKLH